MCKWHVWTVTSSFHILMSCYCWTLPLFPVPLVSRICPSDTYRVWKRGQCLRVDTTLMGFEQMTWQRGNRSFIFRGQGVCDGFFPALNNLFSACCLQIRFVFDLCFCSRCHFSLSVLSNKPSLAWKQPQSLFATVSNWLPSIRFLSPPVIQTLTPW